MVLNETEQHLSQKHSYILVHDLPERLKCPLCQLLLKDPIQTIRGELACEDCYVDCYVENKRDAICPIDNQSIAAGQWFKDKFKLMEINQLPCYCRYKENGCQWIGNVGDVEEHCKECVYEPEKCIICQEVISNEENNDAHLKQCKVLLKEKKCPFNSAGCTFQVRQEGNILSHLQSNHWQHFLTLMQTLGNLQSDAKSNEEQLQVAVQDLANEKESMGKTLHSMNKEIDSLTSMSQNMQETLSTLKEQLNAKSQKMKTSAEKHVTDMEVSATKVNVENMNEKLLQISLAQQLFENTSYDGKMVWKIGTFKYRMQQAVTGQMTALHSAPCFTSKYGYKFCVRLYLNGDGMGKCTHLSLFIALMKSEYDNLLEWPFVKRVTFRLINQDDKTRTIEESFVGDIFSSSFQKPKKEMNVASGCPMLISKTDLLNGGFVKDDSIFIEISVF